MENLTFKLDSKSIRFYNTVHDMIHNSLRFSYIFKSFSLGQLYEGFVTFELLFTKKKNTFELLKNVFDQDDNEVGT